MLTLEANGNFSQGQPGRRKHRKPSHRSGQWAVQWKGRAPHWRGSVLTLTWAGLKGLPGLPPEMLKTTDGGQHWEGMQGYRFDCELIDGVLPLRVDDQTGLGFRQPYIADAPSMLCVENEQDVAADLTEREPNVRLQPTPQFAPARGAEELRGEDGAVVEAADIYVPSDQGSTLAQSGPETSEKDEAVEVEPTQASSPPVIADEAKCTHNKTNTTPGDVLAEQDSTLTTTGPETPEKDDALKVEPTQATPPPVVADEATIAPDETDVAIKQKVTDANCVAVPVTVNDKELGSSLFDAMPVTDEQVLLEEAQRLLNERDADQ